MDTRKSLSRAALLLLLGLASFTPAFAQPQVFTGVGTTDVTNAINAFRAAIGGPLNTPNTPQPGGRREINWDAISLNGSDPGSTVLVPNNTVQISTTRFVSRGIVFNNASMVSGDGFASINNQVAGSFNAFSPANIFAAVNSTQLPVSFILPTNNANNRTSAGVRGFGVVFLDVEVANSSNIEYFNGSNSIGKFSVPTGTNGQVEFLGVLFDTPAITSATIQIGSGNIFSSTSLEGTDAVAMDDFIYSEPVAKATAWHVVDVATSGDNTSRILWVNDSGEASVWTVSPTGTFVTGFNYGRVEGWHAQAIAVGTDGLPRLLWSFRDGTIAVWTLNQDNSFQNGYNFRQFPGLMAQDIAIGGDNLVRILWNDIQGNVELWTLNAGGTQVQSRIDFPTLTGTTGVALAVGADMNTRVLLSGLASNGASTTQIMVLKSDGTSAGPPVNFTGAQFNNFQARDIAVDRNNLTHLLWNNIDGTVAVWTLNTALQFQSGMNYGGPGSPGFAGFSADAIDVGSDGNVRLLWSSITGQSSLYLLNSNNTFISGMNYGPQ